MEGGVRQNGWEATSSIPTSSLSLYQLQIAIFVIVFSCINIAFLAICNFWYSQFPPKVNCVLCLCFEQSRVVALSSTTSSRLDGRSLAVINIGLKKIKSIWASCTVDILIDNTLLYHGDDSAAAISILP